jgi:hypothetical protein
VTLSLGRQSDVGVRAFRFWVPEAFTVQLMAVAHARRECAEAITLCKENYCEQRWWGAMTRFGRRYILGSVTKPSKDTRSAAEKARDTAGIVGNLKHESYVPTPEAEAVHQRVARGEITPRKPSKSFATGP